MAVLPSFIVIDLTRDSLFDNFALQTIQERYLVPGEISPQHAFARASAAFADDEAHAQRLYDYVSQHWFMFATPLLSNGGSDRGLPISCFLNTPTDSRAGIFSHWAETGWLASVGGGVGGYWGDLRSNGEVTSKGSASTGVIPFISVMDRVILSVAQGNTRRGSYAAYLDVSHPEIEEFITMRKPTGGDQNRKSTNLHNAVNITDEFMHAVRDDKPFNLVSPKDGSVRKTVSARGLWRLMLETRMQTGEPYMVFIDTINRALPQAQKNLGLKVKQSNLCVTGYTNILTRSGNIPIQALEGCSVEVWNGLAWSRVTIQKTSTAADKHELMRVWFSDGGSIDCTNEHKFHLADGTVKCAIELRSGDALLLAEHPLIERDLFHNPDRTIATNAAYADGFATFAGFESNNRLAVYAPTRLTDEKLRRLMSQSVDMEADDVGTLLRFESKTMHTGYVPFHWSALESNLWLQGAFDAIGEKIGNTMVLGSTDSDMIREMRLRALECGLTPSVRFTATINTFSLPYREYKNLDFAGNIPKLHQQKVVNIHPLPFHMDTFCATETVRSMLTLNGYLTGNCTEITLPTGIDHLGKMRTAVCCLSSVNAVKYDEWKDHPHFLEDMFRMLDNALQAFIDNAPDELENARYSAMRERSVGLGLLGFQSYLQSKSIAFESDEAMLINEEIFSHLAREAENVSLKLGLERGEAPDMEGTGQRFAHKLAVAPNASSSILCGGVSPSIEPHRANAYLHKTLSGSFPVKNPELVKELQLLLLDNDETWRSIVSNEGSVQHLDIPQHVKDVFKTATEIDQMSIVNLAAQRAYYICQAQSVNLFFESGTNAAALSEAHYRAWEWGVKSLYYLRSTTPKRAENTNEKVERIHLVDEPQQEFVIARNGHVVPVVDDECIACQG